MRNITIEQTSLEEPLRAMRQIYRQLSPTESIYIKTGTTVVSRSQISGTVSRQQFEAAVVYLERRYSILRAAVDNGQFVARIDGRSSIAAWLSPQTSSAEAVFSRLLNAELDTNTMMYAIYVIANDNALDIFVHSSHSITDATSLVELHSCLAHLLDCVVRGEMPALERQPFPISIDTAVRDIMETFPTVHDAPSRSGAFAEISARTDRLDGSIRHQLQRIVIDKENTHQISAVSHLRGSSVHSLLLAAFALAIRDVTHGSERQILLRSNVDMRRRLNPHVSTELVFSAITARVTLIPDLDQPLYEIARHVFDDIHEGMADGSIFREYLNYPNSFGSPQQAPIALNVSDMQTVKFRWPVRRLKVQGFEYALGWSKKFPNVSVSIYEGTLVANIVYVDSFINPETIQAVAGRFTQILLSGCEIQ
jgi:hypothetical protein